MPAFFSSPSRATCFTVQLNTSWVIRSLTFSGFTPIVSTIKFSIYEISWAHAGKLPIGFNFSTAFGISSASSLVRLSTVPALSPSLSFLNYQYAVLIYFPLSWRFKPYASASAPFSLLNLPSFWFVIFQNSFSAYSEQGRKRGGLNWVTPQPTNVVSRGLKGFWRLLMIAYQI